MQANDQALSVAPHNCVQGSEGGGFYPLCDHDGCAINTNSEWPLPFYGPGNDYLIDTTQPMNITSRFAAASSSGPTGGANITLIEVAMSQPGTGRQYTINIANGTCDKVSGYHPGYPGDMTQPMSRPMTLVFSLW